MAQSKKSDIWKDFKVSVYLIGSALQADVKVRERTEKKAIETALNWAKMGAIDKKEWKQPRSFGLVGVLRQKGTNVKKAIMRS